MLNDTTQGILNTRFLGQSKKILKDVDGPGRGNSGIEDRIERPEEGGLYIYLVGYKYPYKGIPDEKVVDDICLVKRILLIAMSSFSRRMKLLIGFLWILPDCLKGGIMNSLMDTYYVLMEYVLRYDCLVDKRYCVSVREMKRVFDLMIERMEGWKKKLLMIIRNFVVVTMEFDSAYRFRWQDIMIEVKKEELVVGGRRQVKEIERLFKILKSRERQEMDRKWDKLREYLMPALRFSKFFRGLMSEFFKEVDLEKLKPDEGDRYFDLLRKDYDFFGKSLPERIEERKEIEGDNWVNFEDLAQAFLQDYRGLK